MNTPRPGIALILSAPSGAGKTTLVKRLTSEFDRFAYSISYTTRDPREGEKDGVDYHFVTMERFEALVAEGFFAEWARVHDNCYGTPMASVVANLQQGRDVLFDIDVQGALSLKRWLTGAYVFILPPSRAALLERLTGRGKDPDDVVATRMRNAEQEIAMAKEFDYYVVNDALDTAYDELRAVYLAQAQRRGAHVGLVDKLLEQWKTE
ncbi:guanylate kinase [Oceanidesulfovibrio marinus]|uniref:Guanylate kinase n=1 Tax=Oceanidesulfovibrio marinus TaxID=370038 RepID=A0A6P1ZA89_9BACT|nr:guanylate kinase [Oceanidesulfovibrio marinus]QJT10884.1 guanylate kinase [Oceanidesulfovibrio marinus]TVM30514.1 guanylate kinase [Oceanidesulfovibrio marinus]